MTPSEANYTFTPASQNFSYDSMQSEVINIQAGGGSQTTGITITTPAGGASWQTGSTQTISWTYTGNPGSAVELELLQGGSLSSTIASSTSIGSSGTGSYSLDDTGESGSRTRTTRSASPAPRAILHQHQQLPSPSAHRRLHRRQAITITYPTSGVSLPKGQYYLVSWKYTGTPGNSVRIDLLRNGSLYQTIAPATSIGSNGNGYYSWHISAFQTSGSNFQVRITSNSNQKITSTSGYFSIGY